MHFRKFSVPIAPIETCIEILKNLFNFFNIKWNCYRFFKFLLIIVRKTLLIWPNRVYFFEFRELILKVCGGMWTLSYKGGLRIYHWNIFRKLMCLCNIYRIKNLLGCFVPFQDHPLFWNSILVNKVTVINENLTINPDRKHLLIQF